MQNVKAENLNLSILNETEQAFMKGTLQKKPFIWLLGMFFGVSVLIAIIIAVIKGDNLSTYSYFNGAVKSLIFIALSLWSRHWSLPAAVLLLFFHLYSNMQLVLSKNHFLNLQYIVFALLFLFGIFIVNKRRVLLKKATILAHNKNDVI